MNSKTRYIGWDTETINGIVVCITNSNGDSIVNPTPEQLLDLMIRYHTPYYNYFYNLDYDIKAIMKTIIASIKDEKERLKQLKNFCTFKYFYYKDYKIEYVSRKFFNLMKGGTLKNYFYYKNNVKYYGKRMVGQMKSTFLDIAQFYNMSLNNASKIYLNKEKIKFDVLSLTYENMNSNDYIKKLVEYCYQDAKLCRDLTYRWNDLIKPFIKITKLISPAYISQRYLRKFLNDNNISTGYMNKTIMDYENEILMSYYGGHFETIKKGYRKHLWDYDINSAYPSTISKLKQLTGVTKLDSTLRFRDELCYDIVNVKLDYYHNKLNPLAFRMKDGLLYFPSVIKPIDKWITEHDLKLLDVYGIDYDIENVIHFYHNDKLLFPFIENLYNKRVELKRNNDVQEQVFKVILNSIYGKTLENIKRYEEITFTEWKNINISDKDILTFGDSCIFIKIVKNNRGNLYNPLWGTLITSDCRKNIMMPIIKQKLQNDVWSISTDGLFSEKKLNVQLSLSLGEWKQNKVKDAIIYGNGIYKVGKEFKTRGFNNTNIKEFDKMIKTGKFMKKMLIPFSWYSKYNFDKLHTFQNREKKFSLSDRKRIWGRVNLKEINFSVYDSQPLVFDSQPKVLV